MRNGWCQPCQKAGKYKAKGGGKPPTSLTLARNAAIEKAGPDTVYDYLRSGMTAKEIAGRLGLEQTQEAANSVRNWLKRHNREAYDAARKDSAEALEEKAFETYGDRAPVTSADAKWRNDRAGHLRWLADLRSGRSDKSAAVQINFGSLHLEALRNQGENPHRVRRDVSPSESFLEGGPIQEAEVLECHTIN
jgi:hypothetical protein